MSVKDKVIEILADRLELDAEELTNDKNLMDDLGADSLEFIEIVMALEEGLEIEIDLEDEKVAESMKTIGDLVKYIEGRLSA